MEQPHPFSPTTAFPLSFFEEDMLLFTGSAHPDHLAASSWADMGFGQGRSVSSIMDPYNLEIHAGGAAAAATSPGLTSPLLETPNGGYIRGGKKRGSGIDNGSSNNVPLGGNSVPVTLLSQPSLDEVVMLRRASHGSGGRSGGGGSSSNNRQTVITGIGMPVDSETMEFQHHHHHNNHHLPSENVRANAVSFYDTFPGNTDMHNPHNIPENNTNGSSNSQQSQKRRRKDTGTTPAAVTISNHGGSNTEDMSSGGEDTGSGGERRGSMVDGKRPERPRLTEEEKKNNHIASEQKRRMAIRDGFDRLTELVPGIEGQGRSESIVLRKTVDYMRKVIEDRRNLIQQVQELGGEVPQDLLLR